MAETGGYRFWNGFSVKTDFDATDFFITNLDIKEDFIGDKGSLCRENDIGEEKECEREN